MESAQMMVESLIELEAGSSAPASTTLDDDRAVVVLRAIRVQSTAGRRVDAEDGRALVGPGVGRRSP